MYPDVFESVISELVLSGYGFCPHSSGKFGSESRYFCFVWMEKFFNPQRKICRFKNIQIRVDGGLVKLVSLPTTTNPSRMAIFTLPPNLRLCQTVKL